MIDKPVYLGTVMEDCLKVKDSTFNIPVDYGWNDDQIVKSVNEYIISWAKANRDSQCTV
jgi:hypothetical protein